MELKEFNGGRVHVSLEPMDCAMLWQICRVVDEKLESREGEPIANAARTYGSAFVSFILSSIALGWMLTKNQAWFYTDLQELGVSEFLTDRIPQEALDDVGAEKILLDALGPGCTLPLAERKVNE